MIKNFKNTLKASNGITLIVLVITIVVILILAGISVAMLSGDNGIIKKAQEAKQDSEIAGEKEILTKATVLAIGKNLNGDLEKSYLDTELSRYSEVQGTEEVDGNIEVTFKSGRKYSIDVNGNVDDVDYSTLPTSAKGVAAGKPIQNPVNYGTNAQATADGNNDYFALPNGFYYAGGTVDTGIVISDAPADEGKGTDKAVLTGNQFVWVPVPVVISTDTSTISTSGIDLAANPDTVTPMATLQSNGTDYEGLLYRFSGTASTYQPTYNVTTTNYREPAVISSFDGGSYDTAGIVLSGENGLQAQYNSMVASVAKYGGFYVGRYELGLEGTTPVSKPASGTVTTADASQDATKSWYGLYSKCKEMYPESGSSNITSTMIWGSQYDAMMNWMAKTGKTIGTADSSKYNKSIITGLKANQYEDIVNNVYDLYGCHLEWTMEAYDSFGRNTRGGAYMSNNSPSGWHSAGPNLTYDYDSSRISLYINTNS